MAWKLKYYRDLDTEEEPARDWLDSLTGRDEVKRLAAVAALQCVLKVHGTDVCETEWGKNLADGLYEFRIRHPAGAIQRMFPPSTASACHAVTGRGRVIPNRGLKAGTI